MEHDKAQQNAPAPASGSDAHAPAQKSLETPQDILQMVSQQKLTGALHFTKGTQTAVIYVKEGTVWHAATAVLIGDDAVLEIMLWTDGECRFEESPPPPNRTTFIPWGQPAAAPQALEVAAKPAAQPEKTANFNSKTHSAKLTLPDGQTIELTRSPFKLGNGPTCDLVLNTLSVQPEHCVFHLEPDSIKIAAVQPQCLIWVNGELVSSRVLQQGDKVKAGDVELRFSITIRRFVPGAHALPGSSGDGSEAGTADAEQAPTKKSSLALVLIFVLLATAGAVYFALQYLMPGGGGTP